MKTKKIKLEKLKVNSFKTSKKVSSIKGGIIQGNSAFICHTHYSQDLYICKAKD